MGLDTQVGAGMNEGTVKRARTKETQTAPRFPACSSKPGRPHLSITGIKLILTIEATAKDKKSWEAAFLEVFKDHFSCMSNCECAAQRQRRNCR